MESQNKFHIKEKKTEIKDCTFLQSLVKNNYYLISEFLLKLNKYEFNENFKKAIDISIQNFFNQSFYNKDEKFNTKIEMMKLLINYKNNLQVKYQTKYEPSYDLYSILKQAIESDKTNHIHIYHIVNSLFKEDENNFSNWYFDKEEKLNEIIKLVFEKFLSGHKDLKDIKALLKYARSTETFNEKNSIYGILNQAIKTKDPRIVRKIIKSLSLKKNKDVIKNEFLFDKYTFEKALNSKNTSILLLVLDFYNTINTEQPNRESYTKASSISQINKHQNLIFYYLNYYFFKNYKVFDSQIKTFINDNYDREYIITDFLKFNISSDSKKTIDQTKINYNSEYLKLSYKLLQYIYTKIEYLPRRQLANTKIEYSQYTNNGSILHREMYKFLEYIKNQKTEKFITTELDNFFKEQAKNGITNVSFINKLLNFISNEITKYTLLHKYYHSQNSQFKFPELLYHIKGIQNMCESLKITTKYKVKEHKNKIKDLKTTYINIIKKYKKEKKGCQKSIKAKWTCNTKVEKITEDDFINNSEKKIKYLETPINLFLPQDVVQYHILPFIHPRQLRKNYLCWRDF